MELVDPSDFKGPFIFRELTPEELAQAYALARAASTPEDWQDFTEADWEAGVPMEDVLSELEQQAGPQGTSNA
jgi:hypothetical protein